jgi:acyl-CoA-binding protein
LKDQRLKCYSLFKQSTVGNCDKARPGFFDPVGGAKWYIFFLDSTNSTQNIMSSCRADIFRRDAWNKLKGTSQDEAKKLYVEYAETFGFPPEPAATPTPEAEAGAEAGAEAEVASS